MEYLEYRNQIESEYYSRFATRSAACVGRITPLDRDPFRTEFERDTHRVLHSWPFRRLRNKTQVFYAPKNDHLCTRLEHALHVASIASTVCRHLGLNPDLAEAIALAHDLGHPPFGHIGEDILKRLHKNNGLPAFKHEAHSLRVIDCYRQRGKTLDLTHEVRDGVVCHCGEKFVRALKPARNKDVAAVTPLVARRQRPATLEACVVRFADVISYVGRDFEDAVQVRIVDEAKLPTSVGRTLGATNREMIRTIIADLLANSRGIDAVVLSEEIYSAVDEMKRFNVDNIYRSPLIVDQCDRIDQMLSDLFYFFLEVTQETKRGTENKERRRGTVLDVFFEFLDDMEYSQEERDAQIVSDFMAGMTDTYATRVYQDLFLLSPPV